MAKEDPTVCETCGVYWQNVWRRTEEKFKIPQYLSWGHGITDPNKSTKHFNTVRKTKLFAVIYEEKKCKIVKTVQDQWIRSVIIKK